MTRPTLEVADILRAQGDRFLDRYRSSFDFQQLKAFRAIQRCRTAALGGHRDACLRCGHQAISYNSPTEKSYLSFECNGDITSAGLPERNPCTWTRYSGVPHLKPRALVPIP